MWSHLGNGNFYKKRLGKKKQERLNLCQSNVWPKWKPVPVWTKSQVWTFTLTIIGTPTLETTLLLQYIGDLRKEIRELPNEFHSNIRWLWFWLRCERAGYRGSKFQMITNNLYMLHCSGRQREMEKGKLRSLRKPRENK